MWRTEATQTMDLQPSTREPQAGPSPGRGLFITLGMGMPESGKGHNERLKHSLGPGTMGRVGTQRRWQNPHKKSEGTDSQTPTMRLGG